MNVTQATTPAPVTVPEPGQYWAGQGGIYAGVLPGNAEHGAQHLVFSTDEGVELKWSDTSVDQFAARSTFDGAANTETLIEAAGDYPAAKWAHAYEKDGHHDFHLPSREEWDVAAAKIPSQFSNNTWYWTSTEHSYNEAYGENFAGVENESFYKVFTGNVRAARTIPAPEYDMPLPAPAPLAEPVSCAPAAARFA
ncbi:hypothetical protein AB1286_14510 [Trinickia sp. NRRL B-1857]|uniref:hypothetical protein n=1 Tax=Trinickia sp. NRRL B-1857 TaxID=3162879 RepID=UPI003D2D0E07